MYGIIWGRYRCALESVSIQQQWRYLRNFSTSRCNCQIPRSSSHYSALGITPKATQADVKAAYYKLSKLYHPDRQYEGPHSEENTQKFREVTAAYEVLGNVKLRRLYDKGMHHVGELGVSPAAWRTRPEGDDDPKMKFYRSREVRSRPPPPAGGTPVYDFNEWSKQHYGATFMRDQDIKRNRERRSANSTAQMNDVKMERVLFTMGVLIFICMFLNANMNNHDQVIYKKERNTVGINTNNKE